MAAGFLPSQALDILQLIEALERQSKEIAGSIRALGQKRRNVFTARFELLDRIGQFETLLALIEGRLDRFPADKRPLLLDRIHELNLYVIRHTLRSTLVYCKRLTKQAGAPLWGRVILQRDLHMLGRMERQMRAGPLAGQVVDEDFALQRQAVEAVTALIDVSPDMPDFEHEPDLMPPRLAEPKRRVGDLVLPSRTADEAEADTAAAAKRSGDR